MNDVDRWIDSGENVEDGLRLLGELAPSPWLEVLVRKAPRYSSLLKARLSPFASARPDPPPAPGGGWAFRRKWPFLEEEDCPAELKILAADMITSWHAFSHAHEDLYSCGTLEECYDTAKKVIENFRQNRRIYSEFAYYKEHHALLGKHPIFAESRKLESLRRAPLSSLVKMKSNLEKNIWRIAGRIKAGERPDLQAQREERLAACRRELADVKRIISDYDRTGPDTK